MGINGYQLVILVVLALLILGPERLPDYAKKLAHWVRQLRVFAQDARVRFKEETGTDFDDVNWRQYDPRQYDPRRIIREALSEDYEETRRAVGSVRDAARLDSGTESRSGEASEGPHGSVPAAAASPSAGQASDQVSGQPSSRPADQRPPDLRASDPRALFGGSAGPSAVSGAVAAGLAGAATQGVTGRSVTVHSGSAPSGSAEAGFPEEPEPAPFDVDAT